MTVNILFAAPAENWDEYQKPLTQALDALGLPYRLGTDIPATEVDYIVFSPSGPVSDMAPFTRVKAVLSLWAGVETIVTNTTLTVPLARMVDAEGLTAGMVQWVTGHVLRYHLGMDAHIINPGNDWAQGPSPLPCDRPVTILGMGALGQACAAALIGLGFPVTGWSRTPKQMEGARCLHGDDGLTEALTDAAIVVLLLPDTAATENVMNAERLALMARGGFIINPGRGPLIDDDALLAALDTGQIAHATLDVFRVEPLPQDHPFWAHSRVTVTPHIAAYTRPESASRVIAENIRRGETGEDLLHLVDRAAGY